MNELQVGEHDLLKYLKPDTLIGALAYLVIFILVAQLLSRTLRAAVHAAMTRKGHLDRTTISFLQQMGSAMIWVIFLILYAHLIPVLRSMGTALLAGASVASVVIGLAAQSTLGNLVAGVSITIYRPFRLGDTLQVTAPTGTVVKEGTEIAVIDPATEQVWEALRALYVIGQVDDLPAIWPYERELPDIPDHVRRQALETERAIRERAGVTGTQM